MSGHPVDAHVGKRLRLRRNLLGMSQEALGKAVGLTFQQVQKYEKGTNRIGAGRLFDFAKILSVPIAYFFEGLEEGATAKGFAENEASDFEYEDMSNKESMALIRAFNKVSDPQVRKRILGLVKSLADENDENGIAA